MTAQQLFRDSEIEPTSELLAEGLGVAYRAYTKFNEEVINHDIEVDWRFYNDGKAWLGKGLYKWTTSRGTQKEITAFWLSIWEDFFRVSFFVPEKYRDEVLSLSLSDEAKQMIEEAKQMGKLKFFPLVFDLKTSRQFKDLYTLIDFKKAKK